MRSVAQVELDTAVGDMRNAAENAAQASRDLYHDLSELREMHSQLAKLNMERQKTIETLVDMAQNLYSIARPFMSEGDSVWRAMQEEYVAAMKLAGREPKL